MTPMKPTEAWAVVREDGSVRDVELIESSPYEKRELARVGQRLARVTITEGDGWRPIEEAPRDGTRLLLWLADKGAVIGYWRTDVNLWWQPYAMTIRPTAWQPLPAPPAAKEKG